VSASVNLSLHYKVQKFSSGTGSRGGKRAVKTVVVIVLNNETMLFKCLFSVPFLHYVEDCGMWI